MFVTHKGCNTKACKAAASTHILQTKPNFPVYSLNSDADVPYRFTSFNAQLATLNGCDKLASLDCCMGIKFIMTRCVDLHAGQRARALQ